MSIEKKSLISNRTATKKALVAKPEVSKLASTRIGKLRVATASPLHVSRINPSRIKT